MTTAPATSRFDQHLLVALGLAAMLHGGLLVAGSFRTSYDAYVHLFFADHYSRSWFSTWEPRWYTGFTTVSYPPAGHQLLALWSRVIGGGFAFVPVMLAATLLLIVGVYRFSRIWVGPRAAGYAAIATACSSAVAETVHVFGQLPTILSLSLLLNALPFMHRWVGEGGLGYLFAGVACTAATTAAHHVTTLFGSVFFLGPVVAHALLVRFRQPLHDEPAGHVPSVSVRTLGALVARRLRRILPAIARAGVAGALVLASLVVVVLPYWLWSSSDPITQIPIPHASRDSFIENTNAGLVFWLVPWGVALVALPYALVCGWRELRWPLTASIALLTLLGTGGTTPIPRMLLGGAFEILTLDRFTFWATIAILPLVGCLAESLVHGGLRTILVEQVGRITHRLLVGGLAVAVVAVALMSANLARHRPFQPAAIDMDPIVAFMEKDDHDRWRYLTLGFGDQMAWLAAQTTAESVDGNYHSARRLPELTSTPVERLEGAKYSGVPGLGSLQQFLAIPEKYHLKFVFSNDQFYDPLLAASGWQRLRPLENGVAVWQRDDVAPLPSGRLRPELPLWQRLMWGTLPLGAIGSAIVVLIGHGIGLDWSRWRPRPPRLVRRWHGGLDRRLAASVSRLPASGNDPGWRWFGRDPWPARSNQMRPIGARRRRLQAALLGLVVAGVATAIVVGSDRQLGAEDAVYDYYDALDLRRLDDAHELLDPSTRPSRTLFATQRSVVNGLVASYARLDRIETIDVEVDDDIAIVESELVYVTALDDHRVTVVDRLHHVDGQWRLEPHQIDASVPPDQLVSRPSVGYAAQGRRQVTDGPTAYQDVADRPEVDILSGRLVIHDEQLSVVGEVRNIDVDPAYLTVSVELLDADGAVLTAYSTAAGAVHTALPGEVVPFRIDVEGVAGLVDGSRSTAGLEALDFEPGARTPLALDPARIAEVRLSAKALVTSLDLDRSLAAQRVVLDDGVVRGELRNDGLDEVTVPHLFLTLRDEAGEVAWVDDAFVSEAVRAQRSTTFELVPTPRSDVQRVDVPVRLFSNGLDARDVGGGTVLLADVAGWSAADILAVGFTR